MRRLLVALAVVAGTVATARPASADLTGFLGVTGSPSSRMAGGIALGLSLAIIGFEFEYSDTRADEAEGAPSLRSGMFNVLIQTPLAVSRLQFYATAGGGLYRERQLLREDTGFGANIGGGVKFPILGPLRLRLDYRAFRLGSDSRHRTPQRFYAGLNLAF